MTTLTSQNRYALLTAAGFFGCDTRSPTDVAYTKKMPVKDMPYAAEHIADGKLVGLEDTAVIEVTANNQVKFRVLNTDYSEEPVSAFSEEGLGLLRDAGVNC